MSSISNAPLGGPPAFDITQLRELDVTPLVLQGAIARDGCDPRRERVALRSVARRDPRGQEHVLHEIGNVLPSQPGKQHRTNQAGVAAIEFSERLVVTPTRALDQRRIRISGLPRRSDGSRRDSSRVSRLSIGGGWLCPSQSRTSRVHRQWPSRWTNA